MSHRPQRIEKKCLDCENEVIGKHCHHCGQENVEPRETFWHLVQHFLADLMHFDGKLWHTAKFLILKPGFLSSEYLKGRRTRYVNPVSLYLFTSALFFLIFFSVFNGEQMKDNKNNSVERINKLDSSSFLILSNRLAPGKHLSRIQLAKLIDTSKLKFGLTSSYSSRGQYDSLIASGKKKHNWLERQVMHKSFALKEKYKDTTDLGKTLWQLFMHSFPKMLFVLLPLFAVALKLLYIRRKQFLYVDHLIFTLHLYIFLFISLIVIFGINALQNLSHWRVLGFISAIIWLVIFFYFYKAMRNFYKQSRFKTILKFVLLNIVLLLLTSFLFIIFLLFSIMQL